MLEVLKELMSGPAAGRTLLVLRGLFFFSFITAAALLLFGGRDTLRKGAVGRPQRLLAVLTLLAFAVLAAFQARWQLFGARNTELMRFVRRHNIRPGVDVRRGAILDRNGSILAADSGGDSARRYPLGPAAAHVVGFIDPFAGISGLEKALDSELSGVQGSAIDDLGRLSRNLVSTVPVEGADVHVTLDARLQRFAFEALAGKRGAVVALLPHTGEILALASTPSFDPLDPLAARGEKATSPYVNRALQGRYPPGSTFKVAMALMASDLGISPVLECPAAGFKPKGESKPIRDSEYYIYAREGRTWRGFGKIGLHDALVHSSNVYFAKLSQLIPPKSFNCYVELLGLNSQTVLCGDGRDALASPAGSVPVVDSGAAVSMTQLAIGQGRMLVSPLNVAAWTSAVADGGVLHAPTLRRRAADEGEAPVRIASKTAAAAVARMMRDTVTSGTGRSADIPGAGLCGKTGTAQNPHGEDHSWFTCFTSRTKPSIVVTVLVENGGFGSRAAAPIARSVVEEALRLEIVTKEEGAQ